MASSLCSVASKPNSDNMILMRKGLQGHNGGEVSGRRLVTGGTPTVVCYVVIGNGNLLIFIDIIRGDVLHFRKLFLFGLHLYFGNNSIVCM